MPGMDGTGPTGQGPMTGRGLGPCGASGNGITPNAGQSTNWVGKLLTGLRSGSPMRGQGFGQGGGRGMGRGCGRGLGRGRRRMF